MSMKILERQLGNVVGSENLIVDPQLLEKYSKDQSFVSPTKPLLAVQPRTIEDVQEVVRVANNFRIPVTPYSSGANNQGCTIPVHGGMVIDLSFMNRIIEIDELSRVAVIEPGVTFAQLQNEARKHGLRVLTPFELPSFASVVTSYLEYEPLFSWSKYGEENLLTMHIVLPTGKLLKTGTGAVPVIDKPYDPITIPCSYLSKIWFGAQGTLGIVTQGIVKLKTLHKATKIFFIPFDRVEDSFKPIREIKWVRIGEELFAINNMDLALILAENFPEEVLEIRRTLPPWFLVLVLRGEQDEVEYQEEDLKDLAKNLGIKIETNLPFIKMAWETILKEIEYPQGWKKKSQYKGARNVMPFITPISRIPTYNQMIHKLAVKHGYLPENIGCLLLPIEIARVHYQFSFARDPMDEDETRRVKKLFDETFESLLKMGAFFSKPFYRWADKVYSRAPTYFSVIEKFKRLVDPHNIMNPGKIF